jgi:acyl carrier protein
MSASLPEDLEEEVRELASKVLKLPKAKVTLEADLFTDLGVDSLLGVEIFAALDKKYGIDVPEGRLRDVHTIKDIARLVRELKK